MISKNHRCMHVLGNHIIPVQYNLVVVKYFSMGSGPPPHSLFRVS